MKNNIKQLNSHLEGVIMGEKEILKLKEKAQDHKVVDLLDEILKTIRKHNEIVSSEITKSGEEKANDEGLLGKLTEIFSTITEIDITSDKDVLKTAIKGTEMGFKAVLDLMIKDIELCDEFKNNLIEISDKYAKHIKVMQNHLIKID